MEAFELKYKMTDDDFKRINKSVMWKLFFMYFGVAVMGLTVGIVAAVLRPRTEILVFGIILIVLGAILLVFSALLLITPRSFVSSALMTSDDTEREVRFDDGGFSVSSDTKKEIKIAYAEIVRIKNKKSYLLLYLDRELALIVKDGITSGQTLGELYNYLLVKTGRKKYAAQAQAPAAAQTVEPDAANVGEDKEQSE